MDNLMPVLLGVNAISAAGLVGHFGGGVGHRGGNWTCFMSLKGSRQSSEEPQIWLLLLLRKYYLRWPGQAAKDLMRGQAFACDRQAEANLTVDPARTSLIQSKLARIRHLSPGGGGAVTIRIYSLE